LSAETSSKVELLCSDALERRRGSSDAGRQIGRGTIPNLPDRPRAPLIIPSVRRSYPVGRQEFSRAYQGRAFALQGVLKNGTAIVPLLTLGALSAVIGVDTVLIFAPLLLVVAAFALVELSVAFGGTAPARRLDVLASFWEESDAPVGNPDEELAARIAAEPEHADGDEHDGA